MSKPITPRVPPPPPAGPRPTGNPQPIVPKPNGRPARASLLAELWADLRYAYRLIAVPGLPLGLGVLRQRIDRLTRRNAYFWRSATDSVWLLVPPAALGLLPRCRNRAEIESLLRGAR